MVTVGEMYFDKDKMKINMDNVGRVGKDGSKKLLGYVWIYLNSYVNIIFLSFFVLFLKCYRYEKIRVVGKGAFGNAVLYRRKDDQLMCILKEINMLDLSASDRQVLGS